MKSKIATQHACLTVIMSKWMSNYQPLVPNSMLSRQLSETPQIV